MTRQRALILRLIRESGEHPTAKEIYRKAKEEMPGIALATVYNNLNHLAQEGEIRKISFCGSSDRYDKTSVPHIHLICDRCGRLRDWPSEGFAAELERWLGFAVESYELAAHCICPACSAENHSSN